MLLAIGLILFARPSLYYPHVVVDVAGDLRLDFLLYPRQDKVACQAEGSSVANAIVASCSLCRTVERRCLENPESELTSRFGSEPLAVPSARMANGVILYSSKQAGSDLLACQQGEQQAAQRGEQVKVTCYPAGVERPYSALELERARTGYNAFYMLLGSMGLLLAAIAVALLVTHRKKVLTFSDQTAYVFHYKVEKFSLVSSDVLVLLGTFLVFAWPSTDNMQVWSRLDRNSVIGHGLIVVLTIGWFWALLEHYARRRPFWDELRETVRVLSAMTIVSCATAFFVGLDGWYRNLLLVGCLNVILLPAGRALVRYTLDDLGLWKRPALIIGAGENAREAWLALHGERNMGFHLLGFVDVGDDIPTDGPIQVAGHVFPVFKASQVDDVLSKVQVVVALESLVSEKSQLLVQQMVSNSNQVHLIPSLRGLPLFGTELSHFFSHEVLLLTLRNNLARRSYRWTKRIFDVVVSSLLLVGLSPVFLYLSYRIRQDGGKAFYGHTRVGQNGKAFKCLKFRSMRSDADVVLKKLLATDPVAKAEWDKDFKLKNDPRITSVGHFLRKTSLDELPQLLNVLRGEMSLVGPRPIVTAELERYGDYVGLYLQVLPGMTGLWQVSGRNDTNYDQRVSLDAWYVQNWSLWYDIAILLKTVDVVLNRRGAY